MTVLTNVPEYELNRSFVAKRIGELAEENHLFLFNYESRVQLEANPAWLEHDQGGASTLPQWNAGVLSEAKYAAFKSDCRIGSFHQGQQAKWTAHELCHALLGFSWQENASLYFHATAARIAELLPVVVFYYYDEVGLQRCVEHSELAFPYVAYCAACEAAAKSGAKAKQSDALFWLDKGNDFYESEINAIKKGLLKGVIQANPNHKLDLASDGLAYARANAARLNSQEFKRYIEQFVPKNTGCTTNIDDFIERSEALQKALLNGDSFPSYSANRETWVIQDLAWRLIEIQAQTDGELFSELEKILLKLETDKSQKTILSTLRQYEELAEEYFCPDAVDVFSLGYSLNEKYGHSYRQIKEGLESALPLSMRQVSNKVEAFVKQDRADRRFLAFRFASYLKETSNEFSELAEFEAALLHPAIASKYASVYNKEATHVRKTINTQIFSLSREILSKFEIFEEDELEELNYLALIVKPENEVNIAQLDKEQFDFLSVWENKKCLNECKDNNLLEGLLELGILEAYIPL
jgi:hypothetical protein